MKSISRIYKEAIELTHARQLRNVAAEADPEGFKDKGKRGILSKEVPYMDMEEFLKNPFPAQTYSNFSRIEETLRRAGYTLGKTLDLERENYLKNICYKGEDFKNPTKIAKVLTALEEKDYLERYINDPYRESFISMQKDIEKGIKYKVLVSTLYLDVAGMSTDKKWTSCMNLGGKRIRSKGKDTQAMGSNVEYLAKDIELGTIVAYLIRTPYKSLDKAIDDSLARISIRPHERGDTEDGQICYVAGPVYGVKNEAFADIVKEYADKLNTTRVYRPNLELYDEKPLDDRYITVEKQSMEISKSLNDIAITAENTQNPKVLEPIITKAEEWIGNKTDEQIFEGLEKYPDEITFDEYRLASMMDAYLLKHHPYLGLKLYLFNEIQDVWDFVDTLKMKKELASICEDNFDHTSQDFINLIQALSSRMSTASHKERLFEDYLFHLAINSQYQKVCNILLSSKFKIFMGDNLEEYLDLSLITVELPKNFQDLIAKNLKI